MRFSPKFFLYGSLVLIAGSLIAILRLSAWKTVSISDIRWRQSGKIIALQNAKRDQERGLLFIRLKDAKEQFMPGNWTSSIAPSGNIYAYTNDLGSATSTNGRAMYMLARDGKIYSLATHGIPGKITSVAENPKTTYLNIQYVTSTQSGYCLLERLGSGTNAVCKTIEIPAVQAAWDPNKDQELVLKTSDNALFTYDTWESGASSTKQIKVDDDKDEFDRLTTLFNGSTKKADVERFLNVLAVKNKDRTSYYRLPLFSEVAWLDENEHLLVKEQNQLSVYELSTKQRAILLEEPNVGELKLQY